MWKVLKLLFRREGKPHVIQMVVAHTDVPEDLLKHSRADTVSSVAEQIAMQNGAEFEAAYLGRYEE